MNMLHQAFNRKAFQYFRRNLTSKVNNPSESPESWQLRFLKYGCLTMGTILTLYLVASSRKCLYLQNKEKNTVVSLDDSVEKGSPSK